MKTPISYYGGKQAIINHILPLIPSHDIYTETFFGGGTVFWAKDPVRNETINDRLDIVINFYKVLKTNYRPLKKLIQASLISRSMQQTATRMLKKQIPADEITLAWAFWYCCNFSFSCKIGAGIKYANEQNTIVTTTLLNKKNEFTEILAARIERTQIECIDALIVLNSRNVQGAFHYLDTPYFNSDLGHYPGYSEENFKSLLHWCANDCKGKFLLSNYNSDVLEQFTRVHGWNKKEITHRLKAPRKSGSAKVEVLIWNYDIPKTKDLFNQ
ncbi:MAG: DNA adenine methylase [Ferruginibacter sp.]